MGLFVSNTIPGTRDPDSPPMPNDSNRDVYTSTDLLAPNTSTATPYGSPNMIPREIPATIEVENMKIMEH